MQESTQPMQEWRDYFIKKFDDGGFEWNHHEGDKGGKPISPNRIWNEFIAPTLSLSYNKGREEATKELNLAWQGEDEYTKNVAVGNIKDFIESELALARQSLKDELVKEFEGKKLNNTNDESTSDWFYGYGNNSAIDDIINLIKRSA